MSGASKPLAPVPAKLMAPAGRSCFGHFTAADAMYAPVVTRFDTYGGKLDDDIRAYVDAVLGTPAMKQWYAEAAQEPWPEPGPTSERMSAWGFGIIW
jgi:glutathione S-transferase